MRDRLLPVIRWALIIAMFAVAAFAFHELPHEARIAIHWNANGEPDRWMGKLPGLLVVPMVALILSLMISSLPDDYSRPGIRQVSGSGQKRILLPLLLVLLAAEILIAVNALGHVVDPAAYISVAIGVLYLFVGSSSRTLSFGLLAGLRNPLTPQHNTLEGTGNKFIRWIFVASGLVIVINAFVMSGSERAIGMILFSVGVPVIAMVYTFSKSRS